MKFLIADQHSSFVDSLETLLEAFDHDVVATANNDAEAIAKAVRLQPEVALINSWLPRFGGIETTRQIVRSTLATQVLLLVEFEDRSLIAEAQKAGAIASLDRNADSEALMNSLEKVLSGARALKGQAVQ